jgi:hypothetical protein
MPTEPQGEYLPPSHFIKHLENNLFERHRGVREETDFHIYYLDLTPLQLDVGLYIPFFVPTGLPVGKWVTAAQLDPIVEKVRGYQHPGDNSRYFSVIVIGNKLQYDPKKRGRNIGRHDIAVIDLATLREAYKHDDPETLTPVVAKPLIEYLGREKLSPYKHSTIAIAGRFFGRSDLLGRVHAQRSTNFTFCGNRRIGKTSLLMEIRRQLRKRDVETAWVYGNTCHSTGDVLKQIVQELGIAKPEQAVSESVLTEEFPSLIQSITRTRDVAIFIDELDHVLEFDDRQSNRLLELLRGVSQQERCRVFMAGFRKTLDATRRREHPLFNFGQNPIVAGLTRGEISNMVTGPLSRLGFAIEPDLAVAIETETAGQPELIQVFCDVILRHFTPGPRLKPAEVLEKVFQGETFREKVLGAFLMNFNPLEKLASYALFEKAEREGADFDQFEFSFKDLDQVLTAQEQQLTEAEENVLLNNLRAGGAILPVREGVAYRVAVPQLGRYCAMMGLDSSIEKAKQDLKLQDRRLPALFATPQGA